MVAPVKLVCSLARFTGSFRSSFFLQAIWRLCGVSSGIMQLLDWKQFFLFARSCIAVYVDRTELALAVTESRLMLPVPLSSWSVPTPPVQVVAQAAADSSDEWSSSED